MHRDREDSPMSAPINRRTPTGSRRRAGGGAGSSRHSHGDSSISSSYSTSSAKGSECVPLSRSQPVTPRRQIKQSTCLDNHGIRPPAPEQYLTPLQQKEVCIRHLRARLRENVEKLQDRDLEIDELRGQLVRMQEDWIEEECHRVEAQMALKEARKEIRQLQTVVETVRTNLGSPGSGGGVAGGGGGSCGGQASNEPKSEGWYGTRSVGGGAGGLRLGMSRSCGCSPAHTMSRSATYTRLSTEPSPSAAAADRNGNVGLGAGPGTMKSMTLPRGDGRTHLLLEAALLTEPLGRCPGVQRSSTYERLCSGETLLPVPLPLPAPAHSLPHPGCCHALNNNCSCGAPHTFMPHHHLFLHLPQEDTSPPPPPTQAPIPPPPPPAPLAQMQPASALAQNTHVPSAPSSVRSESSEVSDRPGYRSQACSPTITWLSEETTGEEEVSLLTTASAGPSPSPITPACTNPLVTPTIVAKVAEASLPSNATPLLSLSTSTPTSSNTPLPTCMDITEASPLDGGSSLEFLPPPPPPPAPVIPILPTTTSHTGSSFSSSCSPLPSAQASTAQTQQPVRGSHSPMAEEFCDGPAPLPAPPASHEVLVMEASDEDDDVRSPLSADTARAHRAEEEEGDEDEDDDDGANDPPQRCHWSRYFLVDLLAVAVPVVPAVAWLCQGARRPDLPVYPIGSLLRGCCAVALHSLRRVGRGRGRGKGPANTGGATNI